MADTFEEVAELKGDGIFHTFHAKEGETKTGKIEEADATARTVTLSDGEIVTFPEPSVPMKEIAE